MREGVSGEFETRHDGPFTLKAERRMLTRNIKEYRQKIEALTALKKQIALPAIHVNTAGETREYCYNCGEDLEGKEWNYEYGPYCGQRLEWGDD